MDIDIEVIGKEAEKAAEKAVVEKETKVVFDIPNFRIDFYFVAYYRRI